MTSAFVFHSDAGHGWLAVPIAAARAVRVPPSERFGSWPSRYSYKSRDGQTLYLEEDCDAPRFLDAWTKAHGAPAIVEQSDGDSSPIRALPHIVT